MIYFDNAATTLKKPPSVKAAVMNALDNLGNPSRGAYKPALDALRIVYDTRERLAELFGANDPSRIAFTNNATESLNIAIKGVLNKNDHVITTVCEHNSVLRPLYEKENSGCELTIINSDNNGKINSDDIEKAVKLNTKAIVISHASNLTGNIVNLEEISHIAGKHGLLLIVDAAQTAGCIDINVIKSGIDILCFTGHKGLMGPMGTGGIYVRKGLDLNPLKTGGSGIKSFDKAHPREMPDRLEAGTLNCHGIAGLNAALDFIDAVGTDNIYYKENSLAELFISGISHIGGIIIYGDISADIKAPIVTINIKGYPSDILCDRLWTDFGICTRAGAHCAPLMHKALGTDKTGAVRFSFSYFNTENEVHSAINALEKIAAEV